MLEKGNIYYYSTTLGKDVLFNELDYIFNELNVKDDEDYDWDYVEKSLIKASDTILRSLESFLDDYVEATLDNCIKVTSAKLYDGPGHVYYVPSNTSSSWWDEALDQIEITFIMLEDKDEKDIIDLINERLKYFHIEQVSFGYSCNKVNFEDLLGWSSNPKITFLKKDE